MDTGDWVRLGLYLMGLIIGGGSLYVRLKELIMGVRSDIAIVKNDIRYLKANGIVSVKGFEKCRNASSAKFKEVDADIAELKKNTTVLKTRMEKK
jgi:hypothetical protein